MNNSSINHERRIVQTVGTMRQKPAQNFNHWVQKSSKYPMDIDAVSIVNGCVDVYGYKHISAPPYSQGEIITSLTITEAQKNHGLQGYYIQVLHDTSPDEPITDDRAYVWRVWYGVDIVREYVYGEMSVAQFKLERGDVFPSFKLDYCYQSVVNGAFLLGIYSPDECEIAQAVKMTDILSSVGLPTFLLIFPPTDLASNGQVSTDEIVVKRAYGKGERLKSEGESVDDVQKRFQEHFENQRNRTFKNFKSYIFHKYKCGHFNRSEYERLDKKLS